MTRRTRVVHEPELGRYEIRSGDELLGFTEYRDRAGRRIFVHTEIAAGHEGRGLATTLIRSALDDTRAARMPVTPRCPFVRAFIERHPEYAADPT